MRRIKFSILLFVISVFSLLMTSYIEAASPGVEAAKIKRRLVKAITIQSESETLSAVKELIKAGEPGAKALLSVLTRLPGKAVSSYWLILDGLGAFRDPGAYSVIGDAILRYRRAPIGGDLLLAMQSSHSRFVIRVVRRVLKACPYQMQLSALEIAAKIPVRRTVDILIDTLEREVHRSKGDLKFHVINILESLTGQNYGEGTVNWRGWWTRNRSKGLKEIKRESRSTQTVVDVLDPVREKGFTGLEKRSKGWVLVITASEKEMAYDHIEFVLERMGIPYKAVTKEEFSDPKFSMAKVHVIAINCMQWREYCRNPNHHAGGDSATPRLKRCVGPGPHIMRGYKFSNDAVKKLAAFVNHGGYLFTEDMVLEELVSKAWSKFVTVGKFLKEKTVEVRPGPGASSCPYLQGVFTNTGSPDLNPFEEETLPGEYDIPESEEDNESATGPRTKVVPPPEESTEEKIEIKPIHRHWKIDDDSPGIRVNNPGRVTVLLASDGVKESGSRAVALTFRPRGKAGGVVLHVLSHFGKQDSQEDEFALQNLLLNFILEANTRYPPVKKKKP